MFSDQLVATREGDDMLFHCGPQLASQESLEREAGRGRKDVGGKGGKKS